MLPAPPLACASRPSHPLKAAIFQAGWFAYSVGSLRAEWVSTNQNGLRGIFERRHSRRHPFRLLRRLLLPLHSSKLMKPLLLYLFKVMDVVALVPRLNWPRAETRLLYEADALLVHYLTAWRWNLPGRRHLRIFVMMSSALPTGTSWKPSSARWNGHLGSGT